MVTAPILSPDSRQFQQARASCSSRLSPSRLTKSFETAVASLQPTCGASAHRGRFARSGRRPIRSAKDLARPAGPVSVDIGSKFCRAAFSRFARALARDSLPARSASCSELPASSNSDESPCFGRCRGASVALVSIRDFLTSFTNRAERISEYGMKHDGEILIGEIDSSDTSETL